MIPALGRFAEALRVEGISASPAELLDAARALEALDLARRDRVKSALRATLAKDRKSALAFDRVFDAFFIPPASVPGEGRRKRAGGGGALQGPPAKGRGHGGEARPGRASRPPERRQEASRILERIRSERPGRRGKLRVVRAEPKPGPAAQPASGGKAASPRRRILAAALTAREEQELAREIPKLVQEIRLTRARRLRRSSAGRLWAARVFRDSLATGGVPFVLPFRRPRPRRPRVVLLVDVSWSVARAAGYFLWLASEFLRIGRDTQVVAFVDRPVDVTEKIRLWLRRGRGPSEAPALPRPRTNRPGGGIVRGGVSFARLLDGIRELNLDAASDYGTAFHGVLGHGIPGGRGDTILVILGDGRSNRFEPLPWTLDEISRRCRAIVWLAPEPASRWGTGDSRLADYLPYVNVLVEAHDLAGIARGVGEIARRV